MDEKQRLAVMEEQYKYFKSLPVEERMKFKKDNDFGVCADDLKDYALEQAKGKSEEEKIKIYDGVNRELEQLFDLAMKPSEQGGFILDKSRESQSDYWAKEQNQFKSALLLGTSGELSVKEVMAA